MAETTLKVDNQAGRNAKSFLILTATSDSSIPEGEYIYFKAILKDLKGNEICKRTITDSEGNAVKIESIDSMVVLDYNFLDIEAIYYGSLMPSDLKVYEF